MFNLKVLDKYIEVKSALAAVETIRRFYKDMWVEADDNKDDSALDEIDTRLSELDVMQVELERTLKDYKEFLNQ